MALIDKKGSTCRIKQPNWTSKEVERPIERYGEYTFKIYIEPKRNTEISSTSLSNWSIEDHRALLSISSP